MQDVCNWRQWSVNNEETDSLIDSKKIKPIELRSFSFGRIRNPTTISSTNLLSPSEDLSSVNLSNVRTQDKFSDHDSIFRMRNDTCSLVIPSDSFSIPNSDLKITTSCTGNYESGIGRRYSDIIFASHDKHQDGFSNNYLKSSVKNIHKRASHHLSHNIINQSRNIGIDEIGLDYMRANGAIPGPPVIGFRQLHQPFSNSNDQKSSVASLINIFTKNPFSSSHSFDKSRSCNYLQENEENTDNSRDYTSKDKIPQNRLSSPTHKSTYTRGSRQIASRSMKSVGYRLGRRKELYEKRMRISDFSLSFAIFGILVMVIDTELLWAGIYRKNSIYSILLKSLITISTVILLGLILAYHALLFSCDDCIEDWRIAITWQSVAQLLLELVICSIHPIPGNFNISQYFVTTKLRNVIDDSDPLEGMIEPLLAVPMLFRFYMIFRSLLLHSRMFRDAGSRSIGAMNKVSFDTRFILKTLMTMCPGTVLLTFILSLWILLSWTMRMCEINTESPKHANMLNCMWLIAVTFLSIGYGDIVPHTNCGRGIAISAGVMGSACTALLVAVFARKLELSKAEKHVTQFMLENQMTKKLKYYAANVLRETWLIYKYTKLVKHVNASKVRTHQRKFLKAIHGLRKLKIDQRKFQDNSNTLVDLAKTQNNIYDTVTEMRVHHSYLETRISKIEDNLISLHDQLKSLPDILSNIITLKLNNPGFARS